jgi:Fur family transcriptional regulator, ferric uptake regulator
MTHSNEDLRKLGLKATAARLKILQIFENSKDRHFTAEDIYQVLRKEEEDVGLATVYRVLTQFHQAGILKRHHFDMQQSVFELNDGDHHDHLVCLKCGNVEEFVDEVIEQRQKEIAKKAKFHMTDHSLHIFGICQKCTKD